MRTLRNTCAARAAVALAVFVATAHAQCGDFLRDMHRKPAALRFLGCKQRTELQAKPFEARYRVRGGQAAAIEAYLATEFKLKQLQRTCCVWESTNNLYSDGAGMFVITMATAETSVSSRSRWSEIPYFYVTMMRYAEEP